jgi:hypothetical protein
MRRFLLVIVISAVAASLNARDASAQPDKAPPDSSVTLAPVRTASVRATRVNTGGFPYARLGYGGVVGERLHGTPAFGLGYRAELDEIAVDVSIFNVQVQTTGYGQTGGAGTFSLVKLQALYFLNAEVDGSPYIGGGMSWGSTNFSAKAHDRDVYVPDWDGSGLQGELTVGYELARASTLRIFFEGNVVLPFYQVSSARRPVREPGTGAGVERRYASAFVASVGMGWQRD